MRVTAETKAATRKRIVEAAQRLFAEQGFDGCTTRDIADAASIASGTLFNYFGTKEAVLASLAAEALDAAHCITQAQAASLEEALFTVVAAELEKLKPLRKHLPALTATVLSPLAATDDTESWRVLHHEAITRLAKQYDMNELSPLAFQLYWALYTGLVVFWANDCSPKQKDTLALLDQSLAMFVGWLGKKVASKTNGEAESCPRHSTN